MEVYYVCADETGWKLVEIIVFCPIRSNMSLRKDVDDDGIVVVFVVINNGENVRRFIY